MRRRWILSALALSACASGPGKTPIEQAPLAVVEQAVVAPVLISFEDAPMEIEEFVLVMQEFSRLPIEATVVWQGSTAPSTAALAKVPGKRIRQYWDPQRKAASTGGRLIINGKAIPLQRVALRVALAQYSARPR